MSYSLINLSLLIIAISLFVLNWIVNTDFNIIKNTISQYAYGKYGFLTTIGFALTGISAFMLAFGLLKIEKNILFTIINYILFGYSFFIGLLSIFRCDKPGETTFRGKMHNILAITGLVSLSVAMLLYLILTVIQKDFSYITLLLVITNYTSLLFLNFLSDTYRGIWERGGMLSQSFWMLYLIIHFSA